jgi:hypothetical protein
MEINYRGFTEKQLREAFDLVTDENDWRAPINALVPPDFARQAEAAIVFFTGCPVEILEVNEKSVNVRACGYRLGPCGP